ncbi:heme-degrading monooxygenase HmoA [Actinoplanes octamycinicus]|uniref:Heme-degrading monooxygenase HmoA n=1 Tax=Actinoplanes octamycinicus TaxID=135948 RepID=A0A7W7GX48_9ACTN|nr:antibiotic biosynthesis monooxygenase family protein [Actinoplanes octamycinicus]MBB4739896.1 heme-degrading monooxygenase HmoA [Actinoplanes octamycinicus]GIE55079.1 antibiotic biosynthesis monooxygenase [Actinoplanes octamycinicus]
MILEVMLIDVLPGREADFVAAYRLGRSLIAGADGCHGLGLKHRVESSTRFLLLVEWDSMEAQEQHFRRTERFAQWRALISATLAQPPVSEFFTGLPSLAGQPDPDHDFFAG